MKEIEGRIREKQDCRVIRVKIMQFPHKTVKMEALPLCLSKVGPPVLPGALSPPLTAVMDTDWCLCDTDDKLIPDYFQNLRIYFLILVFWGKNL